MGKKTKALMDASTFECKECGATVKTFQFSTQTHEDIICPNLMTTIDLNDGWFIPDYCKNKREE